MRNTDGTRCRVLMGFGAACAAIPVLAGCSGSAPATELQLPQKNVAQWTLPGDAFRLSEAENEAIAYAGILLDSACLEEHGYPITVPVKDVTTSWRSDTWNPVGRRLFNEDIAARWGYHTALNPAPNEAEWDEFYSMQLSVSAQSQLTECRERRQEDLPDVFTASNLLVSLTGEAEDEAMRSQAVVEAAERWRSCMLELGVPDLGDSPSSTPTSSQRDAYGISEEMKGEPVAAEVQVAVFDASCEDASGFATASYEAVWAAEMSAVSENLADFERARSVFDETYARAQEVIAEHAPRG